MFNGNEKQNVDNEKFYKILNVKKDATQVEIKSAYKKLALKLHPDKGGNQEKFQELIHAYDILSDENKRAIYDQFGEDGINGNYQNNNFDDFDKFNNFKKQRRNKNKTKVVFCEITLEEAYTGTTKEVKFIRRDFCKKCSGTGSSNPTIFYTCNMCNGQGRKIELKRISGFYLESDTECNFCFGTGKCPKKDCVKCYGEKYDYIKKTISIEFEPGVEDGFQIIRLEEGDDGEKMEKGDVCIEIVIKKHKIFSRDGDNLFMEINLPLFKSLVGISIPIKLLDGRIITINNNSGEILKPGSYKKIIGFGMPSKSLFSKKGDLIIKFNLIFPIYIEDFYLKNLTMILEKNIKKKILHKSDETENKENQKEYYLLEKTDKKIEDLFTDEKNDEFGFYKNEFKKKDKDVYKIFSNYVGGFCQHQ